MYLAIGSFFVLWGLGHFVNSLWMYRVSEDTISRGLAVVVSVLSAVLVSAGVYLTVGAL